MSATNTFERLVAFALTVALLGILFVAHHFATTPMSSYGEDPYAVPTWNGPTYEAADHGTY